MRISDWSSDVCSSDLKPTIIAHSFGSGAALTAVTQWPEASAGVVVCDLMIMRPALLEEYWNLRRSSPGSGDPDTPSKSYTCSATASKRYLLSPPTPLGQNRTTALSGNNGSRTDKTRG